MSPSNAHSSAFIPITDPLEIRRLIRSAADSEPRADITFHGSEIRLKARVSPDSTPDKGLELVLENPSADTPTGHLIDLAQLPKETFCVIYLGSHTLLGIWTSEPNWEKNTLRFKEPWKIFKIQRRKDVRWKVPEAYEFTARVESRDHRLIDLSISGFAFEASSGMEESLYLAGRFVRGVKLLIQHREIVVDCQIKNQTPLPARGGRPRFKIGAEIIRVKTDDRDFLTSFLFKHLIHQPE